MCSSLQIMVPVFKSMNDSESFPVVDVIVPLGRGECLREVSTGMKISITILLHEDAAASNKRSVSHDDKRVTDIGKM